jgi:hypothetical protein
LHDPQSFWASLPLPSVALDDPQFVRPIARNSWSGASQALTALRSGRGFDHYRKSAAHSQLMNRWCEALRQDRHFRQQADPLNGRFTEGDPPGYSPAALAMVDFTWRPAGICESGRQLNWNIRPGHPAARGASFDLRTETKRRARLSYDALGADLKLDGRAIARMVTGPAGELLAQEGIDERVQDVRLLLPGAQARRLSVSPDARISLTADRE